MNNIKLIFVSLLLIFLFNLCTNFECKFGSIGNDNGTCTIVKCENDFQCNKYFNNSQCSIRQHRCQCLNDYKIDPIGQQCNQMEISNRFSFRKFFIILTIVVTILLTIFYGIPICITRFRMKRKRKGLTFETKTNYGTEDLPPGYTEISLNSFDGNRSDSKTFSNINRHHRYQ